MMDNSLMIHFKIFDSQKIQKSETNLILQNNLNKYILLKHNVQSIEGQTPQIRSKGEKAYQATLS